MWLWQFSFHKVFFGVKSDTFYQYDIRHDLSLELSYLQIFTPASFTLQPSRPTFDWILRNMLHICTRSESREHNYQKHSSITWTSAIFTCLRKAPFHSCPRVSSSLPWLVANTMIKSVHSLLLYTINMKFLIKFFEGQRINIYKWRISIIPSSFLFLLVS